LISKGRIIQSTGSWYDVLLENGEIWKCRLKGNFRIKNLNTTNPLAVGDLVQISPDATPLTGVIESLEPRNNYIIRKSPRHKRKNHIIASNLDQILLIVCVSKPRTSLGFIDRFFLSAEMYHIPPVLVINKSDLYSAKDLAIAQHWRDIYENLGYQTFLVSALEEDLADIKEAMAGKISMLAGHSGAGKSTILNRLYPELEIKTNEISKTHQKGMHTTTFATMHPIDDNTLLVDTPGIKEFDFPDLKVEEIGHYFPDFRQFINECKFDNCLHQKEPKCKVKDAVADGVIAESRYVSYSNILDDAQAKNYWER